MWPGFDARMLSDLATIREMVTRQHQTPTKEWPLVHIADHHAILVVREWPDGSVTAYVAEHREHR